MKVNKIGSSRIFNAAVSGGFQKNVIECRLTRDAGTFVFTAHEVPGPAFVKYQKDGEWIKNAFTSNNTVAVVADLGSLFYIIGAVRSMSITDDYNLASIRFLRHSTLRVVDMSGQTEDVSPIYVSIEKCTFFTFYVHNSKHVFLDSVNYSNYVNPGQFSVKNLSGADDVDFTGINNGLFSLSLESEEIAIINRLRVPTENSINVLSAENILVIDREDFTANPDVFATGSPKIKNACIFNSINIDNCKSLGEHTLLNVAINYEDVIYYTKTISIKNTDCAGAHSANFAGPIPVITPNSGTIIISTNDAFSDWARGLLLERGWTVVEE